jgi:hypothetical protein
MSHTNPDTLAIVIPYYKIQYLKNLLDGLKNSTSRDFKLYIGDDCSPEPPLEILENFKSSLDITYVRFENRLGHVSLAAHWNRCVELVKNEEWVWVIPDDDLPGDTCVAEFRSALKSRTDEIVNVFSIPAEFIDEHGIVTRAATPFNEPHEALELYFKQLKGQLNPSCLGDNIFRRAVLIEKGGFPEFPKGWCSDHAAILISCGKTRIHCLNSARFGFRQSPYNISSQNNDGQEKMRARVMFAKWLRRNEHAFKTKPSADFYHQIYLKGEYYGLHIWQFSLRMVVELIKLRFVCNRSLNAASIVYLFAKTKFFPDGIFSKRNA